MIVLGMHRSGTSLCSQVLSLLGLDMADDVGQHPNNQAGHWERWEIVEFHDRVLRLLGRDYWSGTHDFPLPSGWWAQPEVRAIQRELEDFIRTRMRPGHPFGFKDPRTARLLPLWTPIFRALNLDPRFVFCVRSPSQVARSLNDRDGLPLATGEYRWAVYNADCWRNLRTEPCTIVYDAWFTDPDRTLDRLLAFLSDVVDVDRASIAQSLETRIDRSLRHDGLTPKSAQQPALRYFYELLSQSEKTSATHAAIARFVEQFTAFQQILPFEGRVKAAEDHESAQTAGGERIRAVGTEREQQAAELDVLRTSLDQARIEFQTARQESESWGAQHDAAVQAQQEAVQARDEAVAEAERHARDAEAARRDSESWRAQHDAAVQTRDEAVAEAERHARETEAARRDSESWRAQHGAAVLARHEAVAEAARHARDAQALRRDSESWRAQLDAAVQARDEAVAEAERHARDADAARRDLEAQGMRYAAAIAEAEAEIRRHRDAHAGLHQWAAAFQNGIASSWSWRLTRPLRRVGFARAILPPHPDHIDS
ncbi:hypothetical protein MKK84_33395 [Methylobacterium sp. E-065]|uniref:hypothetical protein n=1 Tax=Methylobacterium sp. E-065 TaxID=2836583 RepID=UPI001FB8ABCD|nr:hypothetical protein [Methylobacterium sp. E-065]MCJ2022241.1 hypothetical protein [Methylobacterium sp. E-065]